MASNEHKLVEKITLLALMEVKLTCSLFLVFYVFVLPIVSVA